MIEWVRKLLHQQKQHNTRNDAEREFKPSSDINYDLLLDMHCMSNRIRNRK